MTQTNEIFSPFDFFLSEGMTVGEATKYTFQIIEEIRNLKDAGGIKTVAEYADYSKERAYEFADLWLSDYLTAKYCVS